MDRSWWCRSVVIRFWNFLFHRNPSTKESTSVNEKRYWFPAKRYGWGWGLPVTWQGWVVLVVYLALLVIGRYAFPPSHSTVGFIVYVVALSVVLSVVCYVKGEPPKWRWGRR